MEYTIAKPNTGKPRVFKTRAGFERALRKAGAEKVVWKNDQVIVGWPVQDPNANAELVTYAIGKDGRVDPLLAWDME